MRPKVSVIMPVLNGERYIGEAIRSIVAQSYPNFELVVIDDGSTDSTKRLLDSFAGQLEMKYVHHSVPKGIPASMNDGLRHASGDLIAFLDHDDAWFPEFLETQAAYLEAHPDVGMVHSDFQTIDSEGNVIIASVAAIRKRTRPSGRVFPELFRDGFVVGNSVMIRKECFQRVGFFDETLRWGDYLMWLRIARLYRVDYVGRVLTKYRQHPTQSTRTESPNPAVDEPVAVLAIHRLLETDPEIRQELGDRCIREREAALYLDMALQFWVEHHFLKARVLLRKAIRTSWIYPRYYFLYASTFLLPSQTMALWSVWRRVRSYFSFHGSEHDWTQPTQRTIDRKKQQM